VVPLPAVLF
jgi:hypothetical protein